MCHNGTSWCKGVGFFNPSMVCQKCKSADSAHEGMALKKPPPSSFPGASSSLSSSSALPTTAPTGGTGLLQVPTGARRRSIIQAWSATSPTSSSDPYARGPDETEPRWEMRVTAMRTKALTKPPESLNGHVFRGEDPARSGKSGRTTAELIKHGGFLPWQCTSVGGARANVVALCSSSPTLAERAYAWQKNKDKVDGYFVSTGTNSKDAYDNYTYFYRAQIPALTRRTWSEMGITGFNSDNVRDCHLYTDGSTLAGSTCIGVLCLVEANRIYELLVMTPLPVGVIELKVDGAWTPITSLSRS